MPRFDSEGFNPKKRIENDSRDRSVPDEENYYANRNTVFDGGVSDNQICDDYSDIIDDFSSNFQRVREPNQEPRRTGIREKKKKSRGAKKRTLNAIVAAILALVFVFTVFVGSVFSRITYDEYRENQYVSQSQLAQSSKVKNILLLGVDSRVEEDDSNSRSDSMMLISVDSEHNCIKMVSFLRDTWVYIPSQDSSQRLNAACTYDGYNGVVDTIEYNFGIDIDGYVVADFGMFKVLVDSFGGVEVEVTQEEADEVNNHEYRYDGVHLDAGKYKLSGEQALAYCRIRKIDTDFMRAYRQRTVMQSILQSIKHSNPFKLMIAASKCAPFIETNLSMSKIMSTGIAALGCMGQMVETRVPFDSTWSYKNIQGNSVISIDVQKNKEMLIDTIYNKSAEEIEENKD